MSDKRTTVLLAIDQGTTSSRVIAFSLTGEIVAQAQRELPLITPHAGWVEQNPKQIWDDVLACLQQVSKDIDSAGYKAASIGITNQRETTIVWDRLTGVPAYNAIVWQDRRTADICQSLKPQEAMVQDKTGLLLDPYFSGTKIAWILDNVDGARAKANAGELLFGTVESYLLWQLTGGKVHLSDSTNASRTMLCDIHAGAWDRELCALLNVPMAMLPTITDTLADFGVTADNVLDSPLPITAMIGDQQAALAGQGCFEAGSMKSTYGTGCFALLNTGAAVKPSHNRLLSTIALQVDGQRSYAQEGSVFVAGAAVQWLRDGLEAIDCAPASEALATSVPDNGGVYFVPALTGLGAPYWQAEATGLITGIRRESSKAHIVRATLEAQAYQTYDLLKAMQADSGTWPDVICVDGGLVQNGFVCQFLADILQTRIKVPVVTECTAWGAAALAGVQIGVIEGLDAIAASWQANAIYTPAIAECERDYFLAGWASAVSRARL